MDIPRSSSYQPLGKAESETPATDVDLRAAIEAICVDLPGYGYRRVTRVTVQRLARTAELG